MTVDLTRRALLSGATALAVAAGPLSPPANQLPPILSPPPQSRAARLQVPPGRSSTSRRDSSPRACAGSGSRRSNSPIT